MTSLDKERLVREIENRIQESRDDLSGTNEYHSGYENALDGLLGDINEGKYDYTCS